MDRSETDSRKYRSITFPNGLEVLLISDRSTNRSAACLTVDVGSYTEITTAKSSSSISKDKSPTSLKKSLSSESLGVAHVIEHLIFMGSEEYPKENAFDETVKEGFGTQNAYTTNTYTTYYFECNSIHFETTLNIFSWLFKAPLFVTSDRNGIERELKAVNEEHQNNKSDDKKRFNRGIAQFYNKTHPGYPNRDGNSEGKDIMQSSVEFYDKYYTAPNMKLVVLHYTSFSDLECIVRFMFSAINSSPVLDKLKYGTMYSKSAQGHIVSLSEVYKCRVIWEFPTQPVSSSYEFILYILNSTSTGSLYDSLHKKYIVTHINATTEREEDFTQLQVEITFTKSGWAYSTSVIKLLKEYVKLITTSTYEELTELYNSHREHSLMKFKYYSPPSPLNTVQNLCVDWTKGTNADNLLTQDIWPMFDKEIYKTLQAFVKLLLSLKSTESIFYFFPTLLKEKYLVEESYKVQYLSLEKSPFIEKLDVKLTLPEPAPVLLEKSKDLCGRNIHPKALFEGLELYWEYYSIDSHDIFFICYISTLSYLSPKETVIRDLIFSVVKHTLAVSLADFAEDECLSSLNVDESGFEIRVHSRFSSSLKVIETVNLIVQTLLDAQKSITKTSLVHFKEEYIMKLKNREISPSFKEKSEELLERTFFAGYHNILALLDVVDKITLKDVLHFGLLKYNDKVYGLVSGNVDYTSSLKITSEILPLFGDVKYELRSQLLKTNSNIVKVKANSLTNTSALPTLTVTALNAPILTSCCRLSVRFGYIKRTSDGAGAFIMERLRILVRLISQEYFHTLRTQEQLGYSVDCRINQYGIDRDNPYTTCDFITISHKVSGEFLYKRTLKFIKEFGVYLKQLSPEVVYNLTLISNDVVQAEQENLVDRTLDDFESIIRGSVVEKRIKRIEIAKGDVINFYNYWFNTAQNFPWVVMIN